MVCCSGIAKILLFVVNFCVWVVGISLIAVGSWVLANSEDYSFWFEDADSISVVSGFVIGIGCIIFLIGFCGCYGAFSKQVCFLYIYFGLLLLIVILEIIAGTLAFVYQDQISDGLEKTIQDAVEDYEEGDGDRPLSSVSLDTLQKDFDCCGGANISDWTNSIWGNLTINVDNTNKAGPESCCVKESRDTGCNTNTGTPGIPNPNAKINSEGCVNKLEDWLKNNYLIVGGVCLGLLVFEILAMVFACCLIQEKKDE